MPLSLPNSTQPSSHCGHLPRSSLPETYSAQHHPAGSARPQRAVAEFQFPQLVDFTYARGECRSHIDRIAVPTALLSRVADCQILPQHPENLSPHLPLVCNMLVDAVQPSVTDSTAVDKDVTGPGAVLLSWDCADRDETYNKTLADLLINQLPACGDSLDALDATITRSLHAAAKTAGCSKHRRQPKARLTPATTAATAPASGFTFGPPVVGLSTPPPTFATRPLAGSTAGSDGQRPWPPYSERPG